MVRIKWSIELLQAAANKFSNRTDFARGNPSAYSAAAKRKVLDQICGHMIAKQAPRYTDDQLRETAARYQFVGDFREAHASMYQAIRSRGLTDALGHMTARPLKSDYIAYFLRKWANKYHLLSPYIHHTQKVKVRCKKCDNEWMTSPYRIGCYFCGQCSITEQQHDQKLALVHEGRYTRLSPYLGKARKTKYRCDQGHEWEALAANVLNGSHCPICSATGPSGPETALLEWLQSHAIECIPNSRQIINPYELDIYIPDHSVAVEFNGSYWHSRHEFSYHLNKTKLCEQQGVRLIHVWEYETDNPIMRSIIRAAIGSFDRTIQARQCRVEGIEWSDAAAFLNANHIQGAGAPSPHNLALTYDGEIVAVMTFGKPRFKPIEHDWELIRYATALNTRVVGGAARLWSRRPAGSVVTYSDRRLFDGRLYARLGFERQRESKPGYFYTNREGAVLRRWDTRREKLPALLGERFDPTLSEAENMQAAGWHKIWDCGTVTWSYRPAPSS